MGSAILLAWWAGLLIGLAALAATGAEVETRGVSFTEERVALVIGNAAYRKFDPLPNPVNDARLIADKLKQAGFKVTVGENLDRQGLFNTLREFGNRLNERTIAVFYYAGHALQLRDRNYLIPVDAELRSEDEIPINGLDVGFVLGRMSHARSRINIVVLDACRDNPFVGATGPAARGLAQTDAPVGTLLAFATAPGKVAEDGEGAHSLYSSELAKHLLTPGLPVELMFKRVRQGVVKASRIGQVPWESSSLQGEFAFVPGVRQEVAVDQDLELASELAFWKSVESSGRADEYRAYLRQYPSGRFVALAQARMAALGKPGSVPAPGPGPIALATPPGMPARSTQLPRVGDSWRYRVQDQFRLGDLYLTATVDQVTDAGIGETWTSTSDAKLRTTLAPLKPGFHALPDWTLTPPEFAPYLQAADQLAARAIGEQQRRVEQTIIPLRARIEGEEEIVVSAGRFRATKLVLRGESKTRGARGGPVSAEHVVWYAPAVKRMIKYSVTTRVGGSVQEATVFELVEYRLN